MNDGKDLEQFVAEVERVALPHVARVSSNVRAYSDEGDQIAEFDVVVEIDVGTTQVKYLIECRDRPSAGPAPNGWIEQLVARRSRHRFDRVLAVSTTGFAPGVEHYAIEQGIELRSVTELSGTEAASLINFGAGTLFTPYLTGNFWFLPFDGDNKNTHEMMIDRVYAEGIQAAQIRTNYSPQMPFSEIIFRFAEEEGQASQARQALQEVPIDQWFERPEVDPIFLVSIDGEIPIRRMGFKGVIGYKREEVDIPKKTQVYTKNETGQVIAEKSFSI